jgi:hypothetical protein
VKWLLVLGLALALAAPAEASPTRRALTGAVWAWNDERPVCGEPKVVFVQAPYTPGGVAWANRYNCEIAVDAAWYERTFRHRWGFLPYCTTLAHEYGHLLGHPHSPNPLSIMAEHPSPPAACWALEPKNRYSGTTR